MAVGVLAVVIPLVFGTMAEAGRDGVAAEAETRSTWIVPVCMDEIQATREGRPQYFSATRTGESFPPAGQVWALAFAEDGTPVGKLAEPEYDRGIRELQTKPVRYIARMTAEPPPADESSPLIKVRITLEYPAAAPAAKRRTLDFHTRIP